MTARHANLSFAATRLKVLPRVALSAAFAKASRKLIFVHTPKTAGTNLTFLVAAMKEADGQFNPTRFAVPRVAGQSPNLMQAGWRGGLAGAADKLKDDPAYCAKFDFISGHFPYGLHKAEGLSDARYIAFVREPVAREISALNFDYQRGYIDAADADAYLMQTMIDNPQTRAMAGYDYFDKPCTEETYQAALRNIARDFALAAPAEEVERVMQVLSAIYGGGALAVATPQVTGIKLIDRPGDSLRAALEEKHSFDARLYAHVKARWPQWCAQNILCELPVAGRERLLGILPEFATSKKPVFMTQKDVAAYNAAAEGALCNVEQNHTEIKAHQPAAAAKPAKAKRAP